MADYVTWEWAVIGFAAGAAYGFASELTKHLLKRWRG